MAKLYATESAVTATREATQIFGGYGFMDETPGGPLLPGRQDPRDRGGHQRDPAPGDQSRARPASRIGRCLTAPDGRGGAGPGPSGCSSRSTSCVVAALPLVRGRPGLRVPPGQQRRPLQPGQPRSTSRPRRASPRTSCSSGSTARQGINKNDPINIGRAASPEHRHDHDPAGRSAVPTKAQLLSLPRDLWVQDRRHQLPREDQLGPGHRRARAADQDDPAELRHPHQPLHPGRLRRPSGRWSTPWAASRSTSRGRPATSTPGSTSTQPGCVTLDGVQGLAYARSRYFETKQNGHWEQDPTSDIGRIARQQQFIKLALKRAIAKGARNPFVDSRADRHGPERRHPRRPAHHRRPARPGRAVPQLRPRHPAGVHTARHRRRSSAAPTCCCSTPLGAQPIFDLFRDLSDAANPNRAVEVSVTNGSGRSAQAQEVLRRPGQARVHHVGSTATPPASTTRAPRSATPPAPRRPRCRWPATCRPIRRSWWTGR